MKIYTRTGDTGETALFGGGRVPKDHPRVQAYGDVDELNAFLGLVASVLQGDARASFLSRVYVVQEDLFTLGAHLATPDSAGDGRVSRHLPPLPTARIGQMEAWIDEAEAQLPPLRNFILPGGTPAASHLHVARTVCRRAERRVLSLAAGSPVDAAILIYLNRLSDLLFTWARLVNHLEGAEDVLWTGR